MRDLPDAAINAAADAAVRAFNGWPADHPMDDLHRLDDRWIAMRAALLAALPHLEAAIRADEREACAREVEAMAAADTGGHLSNYPASVIAARLRAGEQTTTTKDASDEATLRDLIATLWLYVGRRGWVGLTTEQKELFADVVDADPVHEGDVVVDRWWRDETAGEQTTTTTTKDER